MADTLTLIAGQTHDITITDDDGTETGYLLYAPEDEPRLLITREPVLVPREQTGGFFDYSAQKPEIDLPWVMTTFDKGGISYRWTPEDEGRYNEADGVDASCPSELSHLNQIGDRLDVALLNGDAETDDATMWTEETVVASSGTTSSQTMSRDTSVKHTGSASWKLVASHGNTTDETGAFQDIDNGTTYLRSKSITIAGYIRADTDSEAALYILDGTTKTKSDVTTSSSFSFESATATIGASVTLAKVGLLLRRTGGSVGSRTVYGDDLFVFSGDAVVRDFIEYKDNLYMIVGGLVTKWDKSNAVFDIVYAQTTDFNGLGLSPTDDVLIAGYGTGATYASTTDGTTWTTRTGPHGPFTTVADRVWGILDDDTVDSATDVTTPSWTAYNAIGSVSRKLNNLYAVQDTLVVGAEDGLYVYNRVVDDHSAADRFRNVTPELQHAPDTSNFAQGVAWLGRLYLATRRGLWRLDPITGELDNLVHDLGNTQIDDFGGRVKATAIDGSKAYIIMDTPTSDASASKTTWLLGFNEGPTHAGVPHLEVHPMHKFSLGDIRAATVFNDASDVHLYMGGRLFVSGSTYQPQVFRMKLPERHEHPVHDLSTERDFSTSGVTLTTQWWDGLFPSITKTFKTFDIRLADADSNNTVKVEFQIDEDAGFTTLATANSNGITEMPFSAIALAKRRGKRIRFKLTLTTNSSTSDGPRVEMPLVLHTTYRPPKLKRYDFVVKIADHPRTLNGGLDELTGKQRIDRLDGYQDDTWVSTLKEDEDGDGTATSHSVFVDNVRFWRAYREESGAQQHFWLYRVSAIEVKIA